MLDGILHFFGGIIFLLDLVAALIGVIVLMGADMRGANRGTNAVTRFMRDNANVNIKGYMLLIMGAVSVVALLLGGIFKMPYACLPTVGAAVLSLVLTKKSNDNKQRVEDARYVTKGSCEVVGQVGEEAGVVVGTAVGTAVGNPLLGKTIGQAVGQVSASVASTAANNMTDVESSGIIIDVDSLMQLAEQAGIPTAGKTPEQVCDNVIAFAPQAVLDRLPDNLSKEDKAKYIMAGNY